MLSVALQITEIKMFLSVSSPQLSLFFCFCPIYDSALFIFQHCNVYKSPQLQSARNRAASNSDGAPYLFGIKDSLQGERSLIGTVSVAAGGGSLALRFCPSACSNTPLQLQQSDRLERRLGHALPVRRVSSRSHLSPRPCACVS